MQTIRISSLRCYKEQCLAQFQSRLLRLLSPTPAIINKLYFSNISIYSTFRPFILIAILFRSLSTVSHLLLKSLPAANY